MPLHQPLTTLQQELRVLLTEDLASALTHLRSLLPDGTEKKQNLLLLLGRFNHSNQKYYHNLISNEEHGRETALVTRGFLDMVEGLDVADFEDVLAQKSKAEEKNVPATGHVLYRVPHRMLLEKSTRCVVRVAMEDEALIEDITLNADVKVRHDLVVSDAMDAELLEPDEARNFLITSPTDTRQAIKKVGFTEWLFFATPLRAGTLQLLVRISLLEKVRGVGLVRRNVTLEETVEIVAEGPVIEAGEQPMKRAGIFFTLMPSGSDEESNKDVPPPPPIPLPPPNPAAVLTETAAKNSPSFLLPVGIVALLIFLIWFFWPREEHDSEAPSSISTPKSKPDEQSGGIAFFIHAPNDSTAEGFWASSREIATESRHPGIWGAYAPHLSKDSTWHHIVFLGNASGRTSWHLRLTKNPVHLYVPLLPRDTPCGVFVEVDTIIRPIEAWHLVWEKGLSETETFQVRPLSDTTFYVSLKGACADLYGSKTPQIFSFMNGKTSLVTGGVLFDKRPTTIKFHTPSGPTKYASKVLLSFNRPVSLAGVRINNLTVKTVQPYESTVKPGQQIGVSFLIDQANIMGIGNPKEYKVQILTNDCNCETKTFKPVSSIRDSIFCTPFSRPEPPPLQRPISLLLPKKLKLGDHIPDLELTIDGAHYSSKLPIKNNQIDDLNLPLSAKNRNVCLLFKEGKASGSMLVLGCYYGPIEKGMQLKLVDGEIIRL